MRPREHSSASPVPVTQASSVLPSAPPRSMITTWLRVPRLLGHLLFGPELIRRIMLGKAELCEAPVMAAGEAMEDGPFIRAGSWESRGGSVCSRPDLGTCLLVGLTSQPVLMTLRLLGFGRHWLCLRNRPSRSGCHALFRIGYLKRNI